jgi:NAD-dependent dihydropyrimidine dehydrogenase PreA subunit
MIFVNYEDCNGCGDCVSACQFGAILLQNNVAIIDQDICEGCQACIEACPQGALGFREAEPLPEKVIMVTERTPLETEPVRITTASPSLRGQILPVLSSVLVWTGREILPRLADFVLKALDRRLQTADLGVTNQPVRVDAQRSPQSSGGRRRRKRQRQQVGRKN